MLLVSITWLFSSINLNAQNGYLYSVDLTNRSNDQVKVSLRPPAFEKDTALFCLPKIVPGTYDIYDFGRFITNVQAFDKAGKSLQVNQINTNCWQIANYKQATEITYYVNDTWDAENVEGAAIFEPAGTNISTKNIMMNTFGFFGYFKGKDQLPITIKITRKDSLYASTGLVFTTIGNTDIFKVKDYHKLADSPIMYNVPDTTFIKVGNANVLVSVYSKKDGINSQFVAGLITEILEAQRKYMGGQLPIKKYAFILYFTEKVSFGSGYGALEHSNSSVYYLPGINKMFLTSTIKDVSAHEFFHIITPLNLHSEEIAYFDFNNPKMSKHLWLYEGSTEYAASHVQLVYNLIDEASYLSVIKRKITMSGRYNDTLPMTKMSENVLTLYEDQYTNVYAKGALVGLCLDIILNKSTNGKKNLRWLKATLSEKYGKNKPFDDDKLFNEIAAITNPQVKAFLQNFVAGNNPLPLQKVLGYIGIAYKPTTTDTVFNIGVYSSGLEFNKEQKAYLIANKAYISQAGQQLGLLEGDVIVAVNDIALKTQDALQNILERWPENNAGKTLKLTIKRPKINTEKSKTEYETLNIKGQIGIDIKKRKSSLKWLENTSKSQQQTKQNWMAPTVLSQ